MWRFIVITFGFLGFAFYELSGGDDYQPADGSRQAIAIERSKADAQRRLAEAQSKPTAPAPTHTIRTQSNAPEATIILASVNTTAPIDRPAKKPDATKPTTPVIDSAKAAALLSQAKPEAEPQDDIREVTGSRVNLRQGPGTDYQRVGTLSRGDKVLVLSETGDGWVKLRVAETGRIGYMADFLLTASN